MSGNTLKAAFVIAGFAALFGGETLAQVLVGSIPAPSSTSQSLTYDGEAFWSGDNSNRLVRFSPVNGAALDTITSPVNGSDGLVYANGTLWTISGNLSRQQIYQLDAATGVVLDSIPDPAAGYAGGMAADGNDFWVSRYFPSNKMLKISSETGARLDSLNAFGDQVRGVAYSEGYLWTTSVNADGDVVYRFDAETGELNWQFTLPEHATLPDRRIRGLAWVDGFLWVIAIDQNSNQNRVLQYDVSNAISPDIALDSTFHDFGEQVVGFPVDWNMVVTNIGNVSLRLDSVTFSVGIGMSVVAANFPLSIPAEQAQSLTIRFDPPEPRTYADTLWIHSNDSDEPVVGVTLSGIAHADEGNISVSPTTLDFGQVWYPSPTLSSSRIVEITNTGHGNLTIEAAEITSGLSYSADAPGLPAVLAPQESLLVRVWFAPHESGFHNGTLTIGSTDPDQLEFNVVLNGEGVIADFDAGESIWTYRDPLESFDVGINAVTAIGDVNGDGIPEVIACGGTGLTACINGASANSADTLWTYNSRADQNHAGMVYYDRALSGITDITGDGVDDVIIGTAGGSLSVIALSGLTGEELWLFDTRWWAGGGWVNDVEGFVDIDGDFIADVLASGGSDGGGGGPRRVFALSGASGELLWEGPAYASFYAFTTVQDFTGDFIPEVLGGTTSWVICMNGATGQQIFQTSIGANSPVFDIEWMGNANPGVNTSDDVAAASAYLGIYAIDGETGQQLWLRSTAGTFVYELTVLPDMTGDGVREVIYGTTSGHVVCLDGAQGFEIWNEIADPNDPENVLCLEAAPDLNDDGIADLVCGTLSDRMVALSGWDGEQIFSTVGAGDFDAVDCVGILPDIDNSNVVEILMGNRAGWVDCVSAGRVIIDDAAPTPVASEFALNAAYPNPFNPSTTIEFTLAMDAHTVLKVFNTLGQEVAELVNAPMLRGSHRVQFTADGLPSGLYFYRLEAADFTATHKVVLLK